MYREKAVSDAIAGVTVGLTVIPQVNLVSIVINIVLAPLLLLLLLPLFFCQVNMIITRASPMQWWLGSSLNMVFTPPSWDALPIASLAGATSRIRSQPFYKYLRIIYNDELFSARKTSQSVPRRSWRSWLAFMRRSRSSKPSPSCLSMFQYGPDYAVLLAFLSGLIILSCGMLRFIPPIPQPTSPHPQSPSDWPQ